MLKRGDKKPMQNKRSVLAINLERNAQHADSKHPFSIDLVSLHLVLGWTNNVS